jgi:hypothetical protein
MAVVMIPAFREWNLTHVVSSGQGEIFLRFFHTIGLAVEAELLKRDADYAIMVVDVANIPYSHFLHRQSNSLIRI